MGHDVSGADDLVLPIYGRWQSGTGRGSLCGVVCPLQFVSACNTSVGRVFASFQKK